MMTRVLHMIALWLIAYVTIQTFGQALTLDGIIAFLRGKLPTPFSRASLRVHANDDRLFPV